MTTTRSLLLTFTAAALVATPVTAQNVQLASNGESPAVRTDSVKTANPESDAAAAPAARSFNTFEGEKATGPFDGLRISVGGAFTMGFQALDHSNSAAPRLDPVTRANLNQLADLRPGFTLPSANLNLNVQLAPGINMVLESYMSSRHHNEFWVKGGYATIDRSPINHWALNRLFDYTTIRAGMYEPFYGDAIFRRTDGGNTINNPFAENLIIDAYTTEPGMDALVRVGDAFVMLGVTSGENKGNVQVARNAATQAPISARPSFLAKLGFDRQVSDLVRVRLSGSTYVSSSSPSASLFWGDRTGAPYWGVVDNASGSNHWNGRLNPAFRNELTAYQFNPFVKIGGLELFGVAEKASGRAATEAETREFTQYAGDAVYRFLGDRLYVAGRYNVVEGDLSPTIRGFSVDRTAFSAGWFISPNMLTKVEYVTQSYEGFPATDIRHGAKFNGFVVQGSIAF
jgi:hypothetical protein